MSTALIIIIIVEAVLLALFALVYFIRVRFYLEYRDKLAMRLFIGPVELKHVFDSAEEKAARKGEPPPPEPEDKPKGVKKIMKTVDTILKLLRHLKGRIKIDRLTVHCTVGSDDPMQTAMLYGGGWAVMGSVVGILENEFEVLDRDCRMFCKYEKMDMEFYVNLKIHARIWDILMAGKPDFLKNDKQSPGPKGPGSENKKDEGKAAVSAAS